MGAAVAQLDSVAGQWLDLLVAVTWQWSVIVVVASAAAWLLRRSSPAIRYWLWQIVALKLLLMPLWSWGIAWPVAATQPAASARTVAPEHQVSTGSVAARPALGQLPTSDLGGRQRDEPSTRPIEPAPTTTKSLSLQSWVLILWLAGIALQIAILVWQAVRLKSLLRSTVPASSDLVARVKGLAAKLALREPPDVRLIDLDSSPFVCGLRRPTLVMPERGLNMLDSIELDQVILHELAHVRRRDLAWGWLAELSRLVYFFHPLVYWVRGQIRLERELACDQIAMRFSGKDAANYAKTLLKVISESSPSAAIILAAGSVNPAIGQRTIGDLE